LALPRLVSSSRQSPRVIARGTFATRVSRYRCPSESLSRSRHSLGVITRGAFFLARVGWSDRVSRLHHPGESGMVLIRLAVRGARLAPGTRTSRHYGRATRPG
jgi:hypothetical protein